MFIEKKKKMHNSVQRCKNSMGGTSAVVYSLWKCGRLKATDENPQ